MEPLIPSNTRWIPNKASRQASQDRLDRYGADLFESYNEYFFFMHVDPVLRFWHTIGMFAGTLFFVMLAIKWNVWPLNLTYYLLGVLFFYGFGILSHYAYDGGDAKTGVSRFVSTFPTVVRFNLLTATGLYQRELRKFVAKYPVTVEAYGLLPRSEFKRRFR